MERFSARGECEESVRALAAWLGSVVAIAACRDLISHAAVSKALFYIEGLVQLASSFGSLCISYLRSG